MKVNCDKCNGTGLRMPLCDAGCNACGGSGQVEHVASSKPNEPTFPDTEDGRLVKALCDRESLSDWEIDFCNSVTEQVVDKERPLTERQRAKIREIFRG